MNTEIIVVLDSSTSMAAIQSSVELGFNEFIESQLQGALESPENGVFVTLVEFADTAKVVYEGVRISDVPKFNLNPRGMTALRDGIGVAISRARTRFSNLDEKPGLVVLLVITDGQENHSREISPEAATALVKEVKAEGWTLQFLGADESSINWATNMGFNNATRIADLGPEAARATFAAVASGVTMTRSANIDYSKSLGIDYEPSRDRFACLAESTIVTAASIAAAKASLKK